MKVFFPLFSCLLAFQLSFAQSVRFSPDIIQPQKKRLYSGLTFPGIAGDNYFVSEFNAGGFLFDNTVRESSYTFDINKLTKTKDVSLVRRVTSIDVEDAIGIDNVQLQDRVISFFVSKKDKENYPVYFQVYDASGKLLKEEKSAIIIDKSKIQTWNNKRDNAMLAGSSFITGKSYNNETLLTATTSRTVNKDESVVTITEWDKDMKILFTADYTIPLAKWMRYTKTAFGKIYDGKFESAQVMSVKEDKNGFIYVKVQSANPADAADENLNWVYQFKKSDKNYVKSYKSEFTGAMMLDMMRIEDDEAGNVFVLATGYENEKEKKTRTSEKINNFYVGRFTDKGLEKLAGGRLNTEQWLDIFDGAKDGRQRKDDYIRGLEINSFHLNSDGSSYLVWEQRVAEQVEGAVYTHLYVTSGNALVQYFGSNKKLLWEKPVYKLQVAKDNSGDYAGMVTHYANDKLYIFYPDDSKNATKDIADRNVEKLTLVKFGNKDLAGFFGLTFGSKGFEKRSYIAWPADKNGWAMNLQSIWHVGSNEFVAIARKLNQGVVSFEQQEYTLIRFAY